MKTHGKKYTKAAEGRSIDNSFAVKAALEMV